MSSCEEDGEPRVSAVVTLGERVHPDTSPRGQDSVVRDGEAVRAAWDAHDDLQTCVAQWSEFEESYDQCVAWQRNADLKNSLKEKQDIQQTLRVGTQQR